MKKLLALGLLMLVGCNAEVPPGTVGRVNTASGWNDSILKPGRHTCWGRDKIYLVDITSKTFSEHMNILVGGKVNLTVDFMVRVKLDTDNEEQVRNVFESVTAVDGAISVENLYNTFLKMKAQSIPRQAFEVQPDIKTAVANSPELATSIRQQITESAKATGLIVDDAQITNYDWPKSITEAQENLVKIQLNEAAEEANVRAALRKAEGQLKIEEANKLVELKKAEAVAQSIDIIRSKLADAPEYLMWHQIRVIGQAAEGPNNSFIFYPFATDPSQMRAILNNASLSQMLEAQNDNKN